MSQNLTRIPEPRRILLVSLDNLGDLVFASALTPPLHARFPGATITLWCKDYTRDIGALVPHVDRVIASDPFWDRAPGRGRGGLLHFLSAVRQVRRGRFDAAVLAAAPWRTARAVAMSRVPVRVGLERRRNARWLTHPLAPEDVHRPVLAEEARLLAPFGIAPGPLAYRLDAGRLAPRPDVERALARRVAALHPFASKRERCVPVPVWIAAARLLEARGLDVLWLGSTPELNEVRAQGGHAGWFYVDQFGPRLVDTAAALARAALFIGHDSGPLHVAGAFGVPAVGIFAPGEPERTFPQGPGPWRVIARPSPDGITAQEIVSEALSLA
ncbi:MAG: glycosyltransferase family 9 protein [Gemmatimonadota bacterium]|nr:glycosyltransferase family 9 protein [Gemmatimonadota bacterium]MDE3129134.1 glycosyltransferase family 9 protein [Gemmatimonadota bacterium]MDE3172479.1 glycosyltransferase family 9 protein [Gemmatimonadota bacterium]